MVFGQNRILFSILVTAACVNLSMQATTYKKRQVQEETEQVLDIHDDDKTQFLRQNSDTGIYEFGYDVGPDGIFHHENKGPDGHTYGCYGYIDPNNKLVAYHYLSDGWGYRVVTPGQPVEVFHHTHDEEHHHQPSQNLDGGDDHSHEHSHGHEEHEHHEHHGEITPWENLHFPKGCQNRNSGQVIDRPPPTVRPPVSQPVTQNNYPTAPSQRPTPPPTQRPANTPYTPQPTVPSTSPSPPAQQPDIIVQPDGVGEASGPDGQGIGYPSCGTNGQGSCGETPAPPNPESSVASSVLPDSVSTEAAPSTAEPTSSTQGYLPPGNEYTPSPPTQVTLLPPHEKETQGPVHRPEPEDQPSKPEEHPEEPEQETPEEVPVEPEQQPPEEVPVEPEQQPPEVPAEPEPQIPEEVPVEPEQQPPEEVPVEPEQQPPEEVPEEPEQPEPDNPEPESQLPQEPEEQPSSSSTPEAPEPTTSAPIVSSENPQPPTSETYYPTYKPPSCGGPGEDECPYPPSGPKPFPPFPPPANLETSSPPTNQETASFSYEVESSSSPPEVTQAPEVPSSTSIGGQEPEYNPPLTAEGSDHLNNPGLPDGPKPCSEDSSEPGCYPEPAPTSSTNQIQTETPSQPCTQSSTCNQAPSPCAGQCNQAPSPCSGQCNGVPSYPPPVYIIPYPVPIVPSPQTCPCYLVSPENGTQTTTTQAPPPQSVPPPYGIIGFIPVVFYPVCAGNDSNAQTIQPIFPQAYPIGYPCQQCQANHESKLQLSLRNPSFPFLPQNGLRTNLVQEHKQTARYTDPNLFPKVAHPNFVQQASITTGAKRNIPPTQNNQYSTRKQTYSYQQPRQTQTRPNSFQQVVDQGNIKTIIKSPHRKTYFGDRTKSLRV